MPGASRRVGTRGRPCAWRRSPRPGRRFAGERRRFLPSAPSTSSARSSSRAVSMRLPMSMSPWSARTSKSKRPSRVPWNRISIELSTCALWRARSPVRWSRRESGSMNDKFLLLERNLQGDLQAIERLYGELGEPELTESEEQDRLIVVAYHLHGLYS